MVDLFMALTWLVGVLNITCRACFKDMGIGTDTLSDASGRQEPQNTTVFRTRDAITPELAWKVSASAAAGVVLCLEGQQPFMHSRTCPEFMRHEPRE